MSPLAWVGTVRSATATLPTPRASMATSMADEPVATRSISSARPGTSWPLTAITSGMRRTTPPVMSTLSSAWPLAAACNSGRLASTQG